MKIPKSRVSVIVCWLVFAVLLIMQISSSVRYNSYKETSALVTSVKRRGSGKHRRYYAECSYVVNGTGYKGRVEVSRITVSTGDHITVRYNPKKPSQLASGYRETKNVVIIVVLGVISVLLTVGDIFGLLKGGRRNP